jgi:rhodanese-related sulfurtransferase
MQAFNPTPSILCVLCGTPSVLSLCFSLFSVLTTPLYPNPMPDPHPTLDPEITAQAFLSIRSNPEPPILLDVREPWEYQTAHLPNSLLMPMGEVTSRAHTELDPDAHIVVLCHHGQRSLSVAMWLRAQGFERAQSLAGGIDAFSRTIDPTIPRY